MLKKLTVVALLVICLCAIATAAAARRYQIDSSTIISTAQR